MLPSNVVFTSDGASLLLSHKTPETLVINKPLSILLDLSPGNNASLGRAVKIMFAGNVFFAKSVIRESTR